MRCLNEDLDEGEAGVTVHYGDGVSVHAAGGEGGGAPSEDSGSADDVDDDDDEMSVGGEMIGDRQVTGVQLMLG